MQLSQRKCVPCETGTAPLNDQEAQRLLDLIPGGWTRSTNGGGRLIREYKFRNFAEALSFVNVAGEISEHEGHHPDLHLSWGKVGVTLWTHKVKGLTENDFILAAKFEEAYIRQEWAL